MRLGAALLAISVPLFAIGMASAADEPTSSPLGVPSALASTPASAPASAPTAPPPAPTGSTPVAVRGGLEVFASYDYRSTRAQNGTRDWFHDLSLGRAHASLEGESDGVRGRVLLEAVRSAGAGALVGVAGDSFVLRLREAWAGYRPIDALELRLGILPLFAIPEIESTWALRAVAPTSLEATGLAFPADAGASATLRLPDGRGFVGVAAFDGEGYASRELNRGKDVEIAASVHPLASIPDAEPLAIFGSYVAGSQGTQSSRADRATGALLWRGERVRAGASLVYALGTDGDGAKRQLLVEAFARVEPIARLILGARFAQWNRAAGGHDVVRTVIGTVGWRVARPLEVYAAVTRSIPSTAAEASLPDTDFWDLALTARVAF